MEPESEEVLKLAARMGEAEFERRVRIENELRVNQGKYEARGLYIIEQYIDTYTFIRRCLKCSGLWGRAHRNYFNIQVEKQEWVIGGLPEAFDGVTFLQMADLHADLHPGFTDRLKAVIAPLDYDYVMLTGDYRTCTFGDHSGATHAVIDIAGLFKGPAYAILGNHDSIRKVPMMESAGIRCLLNEHIVIERGGASLLLAGIDDPNFYQSHNFERALAAAPEGLSKVLLSHAPQTYLEASKLGFDLLLSGHTHGGQICLPGGYVVMHDKTAPRRVLSGRWSEGSLQGYTSRGAGASGVPARLNCLPEVTLHVLRRGPD